MALTGVLAPVPTPVDSADEVQPQVLLAQFPRWVASPLRGFVVLGSNGEAPLLDEDEGEAVLAAAREAIPSDRLFIAGTGRESTAATIKATRRAAHLGADMVIVRTPGFFKAQMTGDALVRHYRTVADASPVPLLLYNFTAVTGVNLPVRAVAALAAHPNIVGVKESGGDVCQIADLVNETPPGFAVLAGSSGAFYASLCVGATGGILALANVVPEPCVRLWQLVQERRYAEARALQRRLLPLGRLLSAHGVAGLKAALALVGSDVGVPRFPLLPAAQDLATALQSALSHLEGVNA